jgi:hypothetical protein
MTPDELAQLLDVEHRWAFRAKTVVIDGNQVRQTECNDYLGVFAAARGVKIPGGLTANQLVDWLEAQAKAGADGWRELLTATEARTAAADPSQFVCAVMKEPGHGHVAPMLPPSPDKPDVSRVSAAGLACMNAGPLVNSFGLQAPGVIRYFTRPLPQR